MTLPRPARAFVDFAAILRAHGFAVAPDQTIGFIEAIGLLGPNNIGDIRRAARAMLAIPREREAEFEALFRAFFEGQTIAAEADTDEDDDTDAHDPTGGESEAIETEMGDEPGTEATVAERLASRTLLTADNAALTRLARLAPTRLPRRLSYRRAPARRGPTLDMRRTLREAVKRDGEVFTLPRLKRKTRQRRIVLLIDISGSMKERTDAHARLAHTLMHAADRVEAFTLGTRLTRITPALAIADRNRALERVAQVVADFDGGTRLGDALQAFLAVPRFAGFLRGAAVVVLSDGLERGDPTAMIDAVRRLSRLAWRLDWLTPLAADPSYSPQTEALAAVARDIDSLSNGVDIDAITDRILALGRAA